MPGEVRSVLIVRAKNVGRKKPAFRKRGIEAGAAMALAQHEPVTAVRLGLEGIVSKHTAVKYCNYICAGQDGTDMRAFSQMRHLNRMTPDPPS